MRIAAAGDDVLLYSVLGLGGLIGFRLAVAFLVCGSRRVPALNTDPAFIEDMADMVVEALALPTLTVSEVRTLEHEGELCMVGVICRSVTYSPACCVQFSRRVANRFPSFARCVPCDQPTHHALYITYIYLFAPRWKARRIVSSSHVSSDEMKSISWRMIPVL